MSKREVLVGQHRVVSQHPILLVQHCGPLTVEEYEQVMAMLAAGDDGAAYRYLLLDTSRMAGLSPEVRARLGRGQLLPELRATVVFGASAVMVALVGLVSRGLALLRRPSTSVFRLFRTEAEARVFIAADLAAAERKA